MRIIDTTTMGVNNAAELRAVVGADNGIDYVYLDQDIVMDSGITIYAGKSSLVIDGSNELDPTVRHSFTDANSTLQTATLAINSASNINITIRNMDITGRNYYGTPCIYEGAAYNNVVVTYENVTYSGPQITYNPNGTTRYIDCDITISYPPDPSRAQEVAEVCRLELGGTVSIDHTDANDSVFWFRGDLGAASLTILENAEVDIITNSYFMFAAYWNVIFWEARPVTYNIRSGANLSVSTNHGISYDATHQIASFTLGESAAFRYSQTTNNGTVHTCYLNGALTVNENSNFYMEARYVTNAALIRFTGAAGSINVNNPKSFVLYSGGASALSFAAQMPFNFQSNQLNYWLTPTAFPTAGTFDDIPLHKWNRLEYIGFTWNGNTSSNATTTTMHNFTPEDLVPLPPITDLHLYDARVLSLGNPLLEPNPVLDDGTPISGTADVDANIRVVYATPEAGETIFDVATDGVFEIETAVALPIDTEVFISANIPFLIIEGAVLAVAVGELFLVSAPTQIMFTLSPVLTEPLLLGRDETPSGVVQVEDSRAISSQWQLLAAIDGPLTTPSGYTLEDAVVFRDDAGNLTPLQSAVPIPVYFGDPNGGVTLTTDCEWSPDRGLLLEVNEPIYNSEQFTANLTWIVEPI